MESVNSVKVENLKVEKGVSTWHSNVLKSIDKLEEQINHALENPDDFTSRDKDKLLSTIKADMTSISKKHKEIHNPLLKMGKIIDKNFESGDFNPVGVTNVFDTSNKDDLLKAIINHLNCSGLSPVAHQLECESGLELDDCIKKEKTHELSNLINDVRNADCQIVLDWIGENRSKLRNNGQLLEWKIKRLKFCQALTSNPIPPLPKLIEIGRNLSTCCAKYYEDELKLLMTAILYRSNLSSSKYYHLVEKCLNSIPEICDDLRGEYGVMNEMPDLSYEHLMSAHAAGCVALPELIGIKSVIEQRNYSIHWSANDELPIEVNLPKSLRFHSVFSCPILRQQTTVKNPPMRLKCGHVISKDALDRLSQAQSSSRRPVIKCPYCPVEQRPQDAEAVTF